MVSNWMSARIAMSLFGKPMLVALPEIWVRRPEQGLAICIVLMSIQGLTLTQAVLGPLFEKHRCGCHLKLYQERAERKAMCA